MAYFKGVLKGRYANGTETRSVFYFDGGTESEAYIAQDIEAYIEGVFGQVLAWVSVVWEAYGLEVFKWSGTVWNHFAELAPDIVGADAVNDPFPNQVAAVILGLTAALKVRGRKAFPGFVDTAAEGGILIVAALAGMVEAALIYVTHWHGVTGDIYPGTWSRATNVFHPFVGGVADAILGTIRRRKPGVGV